MSLRIKTSIADCIVLINITDRKMTKTQTENNKTFMCFI